MTDRYDDIINLPHPTSKKHPRMPMINRAAQFSPFAALTGYDDAIQDVERQAEKRDERKIKILDLKFMDKTKIDNY